MSGPDLRPDWRDRLRQAVTRSERTQTSIATEAGVSPRTLLRILNDVQANPHVDVVVKLARVLNVRVGWLLGEPEGLTLTQEDVRMLRSGLELLDRLLAAAKAGRPGLKE